MSPKQLRLTEAMGTEIVTLFVGKKRKEFKVHKKLICDVSKYFNDAFNGPFKEGQDGAMYMPEDDPDVIAYFVGWLYRSPVPVIEDPELEMALEPAIKVLTMLRVEFGPPTEAMNNAKLAQEVREEKERGLQRKALQTRLDRPFEKLFKLYFFAEKIFLISLQNQAMDRIRYGMAVFDRPITTAICKQVYANTAKGSMLRKFCSDLIAYTLPTASDEILNKVVLLQKQIPEFCKDLLVRMKDLMEIHNDMAMDYDSEYHPDPRKNDGCCCSYGEYDISDVRRNWEHGLPCKYHEHDDKDQAKNCRGQAESCF